MEGSQVFVHCSSLIERKIRIKREMLRLLRSRGEGKTVCPSEVAKAVDANEWRDLMEDVRTVAAGLAEAGELEVTQRGEVKDIRSARGPVRFGLTKKMK
ncbi:MAG: DUF3253 domain-containing protein [Verrucomicrobiota bacterium]